MHSPISIRANGAPEGGQRHQTLSRNQNMEEGEDREFKGHQHLKKTQPEAQDGI